LSKHSSQGNNKDFREHVYNAYMQKTSVFVKRVIFERKRGYDIEGLGGL